MMCNKEETKQAVHEVIFETNEDGETYIGREVNRHVDHKATEIVSQLTLRFGIPFIALVFASAGAWYTLRADVADNTEALQEGGRYTENDAIQDQRLQEGRDSRQDEEIANLRQDTNVRLDNIDNKLDRLIQSLLP